jgi:hypothetical protein
LVADEMARSEDGRSCNVHQKTNDAKTEHPTGIRN